MLLQVYYNPGHRSRCASREDASKLLRLRFLERPKELLHNGQGMAGGLTLERNELVPGSGHGFVSAALNHNMHCRSQKQMCVQG